MSTNRLGILDRKTGRATLTPHFATTVLGTVDDHLIWVMTSGNVMAARVGDDGTLGPPKVVLEGVLVRSGGAAKAAMSTSGSLIYQRGLSVFQLLLVDEQGARTPLGLPARAFWHPRWSPDGSRIAITIARTGGSDLWIIDVKSKSLTKLTNSLGSDDQVAWSPDSKRVIYRSVEPAGTTIKMIPADGSGAATTIPLTTQDLYAAVFTPDGQSIVYRSGDMSTPMSDIYVAPVAGGGPSRTLASGPTSEIDPVLSPDGRWIAYASDVSGHIQVYVRAFDGSGSAIQISRTGGAEPVWSRDGRALYFRIGRMTYAAALSTAPPTATDVRRLFEGSYITDPGSHNYDLSPDGRHLLMLESVEQNSETIIIHNWAAELRQKLR